MAYVEHDIQKAQRIVSGIVGVLYQESTLPKLFMRKGVDPFVGAEGDKLVYRVPGRLPSRTYAWRNDRSNPIIFDVYKESKADVTWGDRIYSAVKVTDEQAQFDLENPDSLVPIQGKAVADGLNAEMAAAVENLDYAYTIGGVEGAIRSALNEARKIFGRIGVPSEGRILIVGSNFEQAMLDEDKLTFAQVVGDAVASPALTEATLGRVAGFRVVVDHTIDPDSAYALVSTSFALTTGAPLVPNSVPFGKSVNYDGFAMRWIKDYDTEYLTDRSVVDMWYGIAPVMDRFLSQPKRPIKDGSAATPEIAVSDPTFARGIKLTLDGTSEYADASHVITKEIGALTPWTNPGNTVNG